MMETNIGIPQQAFRVLLGLAVIAYAYLNLCCTDLVVGLVAGMFLFATGGTGFCPILLLFGNAKRKAKKGKGI